MVSRRLSMNLENEIARRQQEEKIIKIRLSLLEFAATHSLEEVLQNALDEICLLVESPIGFYHFVEEDQKTLSLQAWSTRTLKEFCKAEGKGRHYSIEDAGVWVDCVYQRRAVIHNDYASLAHRKGLPDGHAPVIRELVVPIMRGGQVMAILGVGNKPSDYDEKDIEVVSYLADVAWEITLRKKAEEAHRKSEEKYKQLADVFPETIFEADMKGLITYANPHAFKQFGFTEEDMAKGINIFDQIHPADLKLAQERIQSRIQGENKSYLEYQTLRKDGTAFHALALSAPIIEDGVPVGIRGFILDITELKKTEEALRQSEARFQAIANSANDAIIMMDNNGNISYWNPAAGRIFGYSDTEVIGKDLHQLIAAEKFIPSYTEAFPEFQKTGKGNAVGKRLELAARRKDGREIDVALSLSAVKIDEAWHAVGIVQDITERKQAEEKIRHMATHDLLTDLPSMRLAMDRLPPALNMAHRYKKGVAVMFVDLDGFKNVNDTLGHDAGDYVLKIVAQRLLSCVRETDTVARVGGDEFLIIATEINSPDNVTQIAEKVLKTVSQTIMVNGKETAVGTSIGIALFPDHSEDMNKLVKLADEAMYKVKNAGKNGYRFVNT
jgi:diguanylate cyclase (GGDEF)-like protein/PAS domain S-box-containing protein